MSNNIFSICLLILYAHAYSAQVSYDFKEKFFRDISFSDTFAKNIQSTLSSQAGNISTGCRLYVKRYLDELSNGTQWALRMFDSSSKISSGILDGNMADYGSFDECLKIETEILQKKVYGKYCLGTLGKQPDAKVRTFSACLPDSCNPEDYEKFYSGAAFDEHACQSKNTRPKIGVEGSAVLAFLAALLSISLISTCYDVHLHYSGSQSAHDLFTAFSWLSNTKKLFATVTDNHQISCLHGIRVLSIAWIIIYHRYQILFHSSIKNSNERFYWMRQLKNNIILNGHLSVDTFFVISGVVLAYSFMNGSSRGVKFNLSYFYFHRYLRLTPVLAVAVMIHATLLKHLGSGPVWYLTINDVEMSCVNNWWSTLLYVHNYFNTGNILCVSPTWYLAVIMQLHVISPIFLIPLKCQPRSGLALIALLGSISMICSGLAGWFYMKYYVKTHNRATPWFMGLVLGYYIYQIKRNKIEITINKFLALVLWCLTVAMLAACIYTGQNIFYQPYDRLSNAFYVALLRPSWSLGIIAIILLCFLDQGGPICWFLSAPFFQVLSKLTYSTFIWNRTQLNLLFAQRRIVPHVNDLDTMCLALGDCVISTLIAFVSTILIEFPVTNIEKIIFESSSKVEKRKFESKPAKIDE